MKLGKDFWFWVRLLIEILKAVAGLNPDNPGNPTPPGFKVVTAALAHLVDDNEDDKRTGADVYARL